MPNFENPAAFFLLILIPALYILRYLKVFNKITFPAVLADWEGRRFEWKGKTQKFLSVLAGIFFVTGFLLSVCALACLQKIWTELRDLKPQRMQFSC